MWTAIGWAFATALAFAISTPALAQDAAQIAAGKQVWESGGCSGCHGAQGQGGSGGDQPAGPSLRATKLDHDQLIETISCGRPGTQMPAWLEGAYEEHACYAAEPGPVPDNTVVAGAFNAEQIAALVDYITATFIRR